MKRRKFIKGLCKAVGIATVIPTILIDSSISWSESEKYIVGHDPYISPMIRQIVKYGEQEVTITWKWYEEFDGEFDPKLFRDLGDDVWERIEYPKVDYDLKNYKMHWVKVDMSQIEV